MKTAVIDSSFMGRFRRMDAQFLTMASENIELVDELLEKLTDEELTKLAKDLPFSRDVAKLSLLSKRGDSYVNEANLRKMLDDVDWIRARRQEVAVYCAAAAKGAISKILTNVLQRTEKNKEDVLRCNSLVQLSLNKHCSHLHDVFSKGNVQHRSPSELIRSVEEQIRAITPEPTSSPPSQTTDSSATSPPPAGPSDAAGPR